MATGTDGTQEELTGKYLLPNSYVDTNNLGQPEVAISFDAEGAKLFGEITQRDLQKPIAIYLDNTMISEATVDAVITDKGVITGIDTGQSKRPLHRTEFRYVERSFESYRTDGCQRYPRYRFPE